jgi:predicted enzyme related to lactoylglutathione lyase
MKAIVLRALFRRWLLVVLLGAVGAVPATAAPLRLPPLVAPANGQHLVGKAILVELVTPDLAAAERFYGGLLGWTFRDITAGTTEYAEALLDGRPVAGLVQRALPAGQHVQPAWLTFFSVRDVDSAEGIALRHGAKLLFAPHSFPDRGREAVFADPEGAVFAVLASSSGDQPDFLSAPGEWIWSSLMARDPDAEAAFYQALFGYDVYPLPAGGGAQHLLLAAEGYARASVNSLPLNRPDARPYWLDYVRVDDAAAAAASVAALGGRVLVAPRVDRQGGKIAVVADPQGAPFGLLEWSGGHEVSK